jgi:hypothetical protein
LRLSKPCKKEGKTRNLSVGWVERFGESSFLHALPSPPQIISKPHNPTKSSNFVFEVLMNVELSSIVILHKPLIGQLIF